MTTELWRQVPRNTLIEFAGHRFMFDHIDGAYSVCYDSAGNVVHLAAWTPVEIVGPKGGGTYSEHITTSTDD